MGAAAYLPDVRRGRERLHNLLGAGEAFGVRVPDLSDQLLGGAVALGVSGHLLLRRREGRALQVAVERARGVVALGHARPSLCVRLHRYGIFLPSPGCSETRGRGASPRDPCPLFSRLRGRGALRRSRVRSIRKYAHLRSPLPRTHRTCTMRGRPSALGLGPLPRQERFYERPQFVGKQWFRHKRIVLYGRVLLGAFSLLSHS
jgi:hypothetical protein